MRIWVVKVGTSVITDTSGELEAAIINNLIEGIAVLRNQGIGVVLVSSGAVACGKATLKVSEEPSSNLTMRRYAAIGQAKLMSQYTCLLANHSIIGAQILLTDRDFEEASNTQAIHNILHDLLGQGVLPILNENDAITTRTTQYRDGEGKILWDNDSLASLVAITLQAERLVLLSNIPGVMAMGKIPKVIPVWNSQAQADVAELKNSRYGRGGMEAKIKAAEKASSRGIHTHIASGRNQQVLQSLASGKEIGTTFLPKTNQDTSCSTSECDCFFQVQQRSRQTLFKLEHDKRQTWLSMFQTRLRESWDKIQQANQQDLLLAKKNQISPHLQNRLQLTNSKWNSLLSGIDTLLQLPDPVSKVLSQKLIDHPFQEKAQLRWSRMSSPLGCVLVIFESRPDVLVQLLALAIKTGNGMVCKGGKEATHSLRAIYQCFTDACSTPELTELHLLDGYRLLTDRQMALQALQSPVFDLCIPRGGADFIKWVKSVCQSPVIGHGSGICCGYMHLDTSLLDQEVLALVTHSKLDYPAACNSLEVLYLHQNHLPNIQEAILFWQKKGISIIKGERLQQILEREQANKDWCDTTPPQEFGDHRLLLEVVKDQNEAVCLINKYGSHHTDLIITKDQDSYQSFLKGVMSSSVFQMVSTRCADGFRMGMGCEIGINTTRSSWFRGPVGIEGLLTTKIQITPGEH